MEQQIIKGQVTHENTQNQAIESRFSSKLQNLRNQWQVEAKKIKSWRTVIPEGELTFNEFCELLIAFGTINMAKQGDLSLFVIDSQNENIIRQLYYYLTYNSKFNGSLQKGILLCGPFGTGKSILMRAFASILTDYAETETGQKRMAKVCKFIKSIDLFTEITKSGLELPTKLINTALVIDELGREPQRANIYGNELHPIISLLQERYDRGVITYAVSNFNLHALASDDKYGQMIGDRLRSMLNVVELLGDSRRK